MSTLSARAAGTHDGQAQGGKAKKPCSRFRHRGNGDGVQTQKAAGHARERKIGTGTGRLIIVIKIHPTQSVEFRIAGGKVQQGGGTGGDQQGGIAMGITHPEIDVISGADGGVEGLVQRAGTGARRKQRIVVSVIGGVDEGIDVIAAGRINDQGTVRRIHIPAVEASALIFKTAIEQQVLGRERLRRTRDEASQGERE